MRREPQSGRRPHPQPLGRCLRRRGGWRRRHSSGELSAGQQRAWYLGDIVQPVGWISYASRRPASELGTLADVGRLAATAPYELVLVHGRRLRSDVRLPGADPGCWAGVPDDQRFVVLAAAVLAANLDRPAGACPA